MRTVISREYCFGDDRPFASCHASTLLALSDRRVLVAWFGGSYESAGDVAVWGAFREPGEAGVWRAVVRFAGDEGVPHWNPVLSRAPDGSIHLFYKTGASPRVWKTQGIRSVDEGASWSEPREYEDIDGFTPGPVKNKAIVTSGGVWVAPTSRETDDFWDAAVTLSADSGRTWELSRAVPIDRPAFEGKGAIQPTLWEPEPGRLSMLVRTTAGRVYRSDSSDGGSSWSTLVPTELPNNNSGIDVARRADGLLALVYNPVGKDWGGRSPLDVIFSADNGATWREPLVLEHRALSADEALRRKADRARRPDEFSYPAVVVDGDRFLMTYTWKRERIVFRELTVEGFDNPEGRVAPTTKREEA